MSSTTIGTTIVALLLLGSVSDARVVSAKSAHHHGQALSVDGATPGVFDGHETAAPPLPNWGFGCDPDFGPNGYNPCNAVGQ